MNISGMLRSYYNIIRYYTRIKISTYLRQSLHIYIFVCLALPSYLSAYPYLLCETSRLIPLLSREVFAICWIRPKTFLENTAKIKPIFHGTPDLYISRWYAMEFHSLHDRWRRYKIVLELRNIIIQVPVTILI